jgi:ubiquinone biosynthesis protein
MPGPVPAERFTAMLQGLGVTFVKLGQHLSLRPDLLPPAYIASLEQLQDHVKPFPAQQAQFEIENALGAPVTRLFAHFDPAPLVAASMAQIHVAVLHDGRKVAVKVRRPGIVDQIEQDMRLLRVVARVAQRFVPALAVHRPVEIVDEIRANLRLELDFHREARSVRQFARAFDGSATVAIPDMVDGLCAENVFVQIFSGGRRIDSLVDHAKSAALAQAIIDAYLLQLFTLGVFHGDPHPGNLFVMDDGRVCFHDFGIVGYLEPRTRRALAAFAAGFMAQDADWVLDAWLEMGVIGAREQRSAFERAVGELVREYAQRPLGEWSLAEAFGRLVAAGRTSAVRMPRDLLVLSRTVLLLESTLRSIAPDFSVFEALSKHAQEAMQTATRSPAVATPRLQYELAATAQELPALLAHALRSFRDGNVTLTVTIAPSPGWQDVVSRGSASISLALVTLGLYVAASLLMQHSVGPTVDGIPLLSIGGYALAGWFTLRVARAARRGGA